LTGAGSQLPRQPREAPASVDAALALLAQAGYVADRSLATAVFLALDLRRPLLLEGEAGVGKTELAAALSRGLGRRLIRLQCYEGLDLATAVYEWNYSRQMIEIRLAEVTSQIGRERLERELFSERFLIKRPLLQALERDAAGAPVLLIDELDRADEPFEAFLLELLGDYQVSIPELGTLRAQEPPIVVITSNRTREIHDALRRRCCYHWLEYPSAERELAILRARAPEAGQRLSEQVVDFVQRLRRHRPAGKELFKLPGVAETLEWTRALLALQRADLDAQLVDETLGMLLKYQDDILLLRGAEVQALVEQTRGREAPGQSHA
jgi:MoxR-like ATPase